MLRILIVDDDIAVAGFFKRKLESVVENSSCFLAQDFGQALLAASSETFDLIILDNILSYPGEGEDLAKQIKMLPLNLMSEIWVVSGDFEKEELRSGITFLPKPVSPEKDAIFTNKLNLLAQKWKKN